MTDMTNKTNTTEINNETTTKKKLSYEVKFAIFLAIFVGVGILLNIVLRASAPQLGVRAITVADILGDAALGTIIGYFVFLRKGRKATSK